MFGLTLSSDLYSPPNCAFFISHLRCLIQAGNWHDKLIDYEHLIVFPREHLNRKMLNPVTFLAGVLILAVHMLKPPVSTLNTELERFFFLPPLPIETFLGPSQLGENSRIYPIKNYSS